MKTEIKKLKELANRKGISELMKASIEKRIAMLKNKAEVKK